MTFSRLLCPLLLFLSVCPAQAQELLKHEVRAVWLTTLKGLDWPRTQVRQAADTLRQQKELTDLLDGLQRAGINTVLLQTRIRGTVIYPSRYEPYDAALTGVYGRTPLYDPLAFAIRACHARGMQLHAWIVAFPLGDDRAVKLQGKEALPAKRRELCLKTSAHQMMNPGVPATADYLADLCAEIVGRYDVDGVHLDYIRYPERGITFDDAATYRRYSGGRPLPAWRRDNVTRCVQRLHERIKSLKPWVRVSCAPVGKYADVTRYSAGGWNARDAVSQEVALWLDSGYVDMIFPMMYFSGNHFYPFALDWQELARGRTVVPGLGIYFLDPSEKDWPLSHISRQLAFLRQQGLGQAHFRAQFLLSNVKGLYDFLTNGFYDHPALVPPMRWQDSLPPATPTLLSDVEDGTTRTLIWQAQSDDGSPLTYNIYRAPLGESIDVANPLHLLRTSLREARYVCTTALPALWHAPLAITAVDAYGNESAPMYVGAQRATKPRALPKNLFR